MPTRTVEYLNSLKSGSGYSWADISTGTGIPVSTLRNIFSGETVCPSFESLSKIVIFMGGELSQLLDDKKGNDDSVDIIQSMQSVYEMRINDLKSTSQRHIDDLKAASQAHIAAVTRDKRILAFILIVVVLAILFILLWDITHPLMGYVQY